MQTMKILASVAVMAAANCAFAKCAAGTTTVLSCPTTNGKFIELCDAGKTINYSFGKPSGPPEIELKVPRDQASTTQWSGTGRNANYSVEVPNGKTTYSVFWGFDRLTDKHGESAGVSVLAGEKLLANVRCTGKNLEQNIEGIDLKATKW